MNSGKPLHRDILGRRQMNLLAVGLSHRTAPLSLRERFAVPLRDLSKALATLRSDPDVREAAILSTCNRLEIYVVTPPTPERMVSDLFDFLSFLSHLPPAEFQSSVYRMTDRQAAGHLFQVTAGLDSMILGETEVTQQVKQAYAMAQAEGALGPVLHRLFQRAFACSKMVRTRTRIAQGPSSIGSVVATLAKDLFVDRLRACEILLWGAGKTAEVTARHLIEAGIGRLWVVNRTQAKSQDLAALCQGGWLSWEEARGHLAHVDIAIVCTQAPHYVIDESDAEAVRLKRSGRPLLVIDLAVPRNVEPSLKQRPGIRLYNVDDLQSVAQATLERRRQELSHCEALIEEQVKHFMQRWKPRSHTMEVVRCRFVEASSSV